MADEPKKSKGGSKLARSEVTTVRLDPKLRYLAELAARKQRRTLSSFIEWAIEDSLGRLQLKEGSDWMFTVGSEADALWDVDEPDRFVKLALKYPELLTHDEQVLWKMIRENGYVWRGSFGAPPNQEWRWTVDLNTVSWERLRETWDVFQQVSTGEAGPEQLPTWTRKKPSARPPAVAARKPPGFEDTDDDIPF